MDLKFVYITCKDKTEAEIIGKALVETRLAACVNILDSMHSYYWWNGSIEEDEECVLIAKSSGQHFESLCQKTKELHSYEVPCIVSLPIISGNEDYLSWIRKNLKK